MPDYSMNKEITINGTLYLSIASAAKAFGLDRKKVDYRLSKGWTPEQAVGVDSPPKFAASTSGITVNVEGREFKSIRQAAKYYGRAYTNVIERRKDGYSIEEALGLIPLKDSLAIVDPDLSKQWHPSRNGSLTPDDVTPGSGQKVWWICAKGHEWNAVVNSRSRGMGCPYCAGQLATDDRNLVTEYPEVAKEWDWKKNKKKPEEYTPRSSSKVWWRCDKGHSWQASISNRTRKVKKSSCPYCANRTLGDDNSLGHIRPDLAAQWHPTKNAPLTPYDVIAGGHKKIWWICPHGHEWQAAIKSRVQVGTGCPKCTLQTSRIEIAVYSELKALFDKVSWREKISGYECDIFIDDFQIGIELDGVYWHKEKQEKDLKKTAVFESEGILLFRMREDGLPLLSNRDISYKSSEDEYIVISRLVENLLKYALLPEEICSNLYNYLHGKTLINEREYRGIVANLPAPPPGESLGDKYPELANEWAFDLNAPLLPEHFWPNANKSVWWRCSNGHIWKTSMNKRVSQGTGCPECPRPFRPVTDDRNLAIIFPELINEWHPHKNGDLKPEDFRPKSNRKVWWICSKGHEWKATINARASGSNCPYCFGLYATEENNFAIMFPELLDEWDYQKNKGIDPKKETPFVNHKVWWHCSKGHSWEATIYNRTKNRSGCPVCATDNRRIHSIEEFQKFAEEHGGVCLSSSYVNPRSKIKMRCKYGHEWEVRADRIIFKKKWCPICEKEKGQLQLF